MILDSPASCLPSHRCSKSKKVIVTAVVCCDSWYPLAFLPPTSLFLFQYFVAPLPCRRRRRPPHAIVARSVLTSQRLLKVRIEETASVATFTTHPRMSYHPDHRQRNSRFSPSSVRARINAMDADLAVTAAAKLLAFLSALGCGCISALAFGPRQLVAWMLL
ncbi:uncharacterized protein BJ171DRAFT_498882 [Polychytrium aggregatum]|uniref:uncharacterized protein n=1 Tax=Polychytrium aggregatum TaxID=110093 RepID=UPI0022FF4514|nr:uncharacterized protein BJ171DRAFT_498882 [Polychytrium aggregatum]KAI9206157.1 hypothetical protein BJ171DRAFT_498882 [Polychytrium aggregatum]